MQITKYSDAALRILMCVAADPERLFSIGELSDKFGVAKNHMIKVVHGLVKSGYLKSIRGRNGGVMIGKEAEKVSIGEILRETETFIEVIDCKSASCPLYPGCNLQRLLHKANGAFFKVLDDCSLAELAQNNKPLSKLFQLAE